MPRIIAYYLPQFHPIKENNLWWGEGFTEWTNVAKAKPLFKGHYQPRVPRDLGFYDLRLPSVIDEQAELARKAGIEGFCLWHYWFGHGDKILEMPYKRMLETGKPNFPFCLAWANHSWTNTTWEKSKKLRDKTLKTQRYLGESDYIQHFYYVLPAFNDSRYITVDNKPLFVIYDPYIKNKEIREFMSIWRSLAKKNGLKGIHFVAISESTSSYNILSNGYLERVIPDVNKTEHVYNQLLNSGFDAINSIGKRKAEIMINGRAKHIFNKMFNKLNINIAYNKFEYSKIMENFYSKEDEWNNIYPTILPQWDRSPRAGKTADIYVNSTPKEFKKSLFKAKNIVEFKDPEHKILFLRSWNEWAEGNYVEPDLKYGHGYLDAIKEVF